MDSERAADAPMVSVVMSVYNNADTLPQALESILSQNGVPLELIVVDDGSTDGSPGLLDACAARDARVTVVHKRNAGLTRALIDGCRLAKAAWIARQDADDVSLPGRLEAQLERARQADSPVLVGCGSVARTPEGDVLLEATPPADPVEATHRVLALGRSISPHGSILFRRDVYEAVGGYREEYYCAQDIDLTTRLAERGVVAAVPRRLYEYRFSASDLSGTHGRYQRAFYRLIRQGHRLRSLRRSEAHVLERARGVRRRCLAASRRRGPSFEGLYFMGMCLMARTPQRAVDYLRRAVRVRRWSVKARLRLAQALVRSRGRIAP